MKKASELRIMTNSYISNHPTETDKLVNETIRKMERFAKEGAGGYAINIEDIKVDLGEFIKSLGYLGYTTEIKIEVDCYKNRRFNLLITW